MSTLIEGICSFISIKLKKKLISQFGFDKKSFKKFIEKKELQARVVYRQTENTNLREKYIFKKSNFNPRCFR